MVMIKYNGGCDDYDDGDGKDWWKLSNFRSKNENPERFQ